jgi:glutamate carboxypeptidase
VATKEDQRRFEEHLDLTAKNINNLDGISVQLMGGFGRPPKPLDDGTLKLLGHILDCGRELGLEIKWTSSGGTCDGNNLAAQGLTTVDSLGPRGGNIHTMGEYVLLDSIAERSRLVCLLLMKLAASEIKFHEQRRNLDK